MCVAETTNGAQSARHAPCLLVAERVATPVRRAYVLCHTVPNPVYSDAQALVLPPSPLSIIVNAITSPAPRDLSATAVEYRSKER